MPSAKVARVSWQRGEHIFWHYRRPTWRPGDPEFLQPMTVVADDERGLIAWLAPSTEVLKSVLPTGENIRSAALAERFSLARASARGVWHGQGVLRIAPSGRQWSVWLFWDDDWRFEGWYVNLESLHQRDGLHLFTADHVLDVWIPENGEAALKDEDELAAAVQQGLFTTAKGQAIHGHAQNAMAAFRAREFPFDEPWQHWRPDSSWERPGLPADAAWDFDEVRGRFERRSPTHTSGHAADGEGVTTPS